MSLFSRYCAWRQTHPMSGGIMRVRRDRVKDYLSLRKQACGFELAPLPRSLRLSEADRLLNRVINPHGRASLPTATPPHKLSLIRSSSRDPIGMSRSKTLTFQMAEVAVPRELFAAILERIDRLRASPQPV